MKAAKVITKIIVALAAIAGAVYVIATYGNQIVAWCKKVLASLPCCECKCECSCDSACEAEAEEVAEVVEEVPAEEAVAAEEVAAAEEAAVAEDSDFEA